MVDGTAGARSSRSAPESTTCHAHVVATKSNAARALDMANIEHRVLAYDLADLEFSAEAVADVLGVPQAQIFKTLVVEGDAGEWVFAVVPAGTQLDLKALGRLSGNRRMRLAAAADVERLTGYVRGSVTVLGARRAFPVFLEESAILHDTIGISGGATGVEIMLDPHDYIAITNATLGDLARWDR